MKVSIDTKNLDTPYRIQKALEAAEALRIILGSDEFRRMIYDIPAGWRKGETSEYKYMEGWQIYERLMAGAEEWNGEEDFEIDLIVEDRNHWWSKAVGWMIPGKPTTYVNVKFFDNMPIVKVASNFGHEWGHAMGMRHGGDFFRESIPYYLNQVIEKLYWDLDIENEVDVGYRKVCRGWWIFRRCKWVRVND